MLHRLPRSVVMLTLVLTISVGISFAAKLGGWSEGTRNLALVLAMVPLAVVGVWTLDRDR